MKKAKLLKETSVPNFLYSVIRETETTITLGWQTRDWNELTVAKNEVEIIDEKGK